MKRVKYVIASALVAVATVFAPMQVSTVAAINPSNKINEGVKSAGGGSGSGGNLGGTIKTVINILLFIVGVVAVIVIIIGGLRYVISSGDQNQITTAKNTILYAVIGLVVAIMAYAIVNWVVDRF